MFRLSAPAAGPQRPLRWEEKNAAVIAAWRMAHKQIECVNEDCKCAECRCDQCRLVSIALASCTSCEDRVCVSVHLGGVCPRLVKKLMSRATDAARQSRHRAKVKRELIKGPVVFS
jgi:hypothetical protein